MNNRQGNTLLSEEAPSKKRVYVIYNPHAGNKKYSSHPGELEKVFCDYGFEPVLFSIDRLKPALFEGGEFRSLYAVIAVGGDGTVRTVASYLVDTPIPLAIIPAGTFNHLAKDLNLPEQLEACLKIIAARHLESIDIAEVNGHYFLNNSSIGLYPHAVKARGAHPDSKVLAMLLAIIKIFFRFPTFEVTHAFEGKAVKSITPLALISNNLYQFELLNLSERKSIQEGFLYLYLNHCTSRFKFISLLIQAILFKRKKITATFDVQKAQSCDLVLKQKRIDVAIDGDIFKINTPLHYRIHKERLTVFKP